MAVKKKYDKNVLGRGLDNIGTGRGLGLDALINTNDIRTKGTANLLMLPIGAPLESIQHGWRQGTACLHHGYRR